VTSLGGHAQERRYVEHPPGPATSPPLQQPWTSAVDAATSSAALPAFVPRVSTVSAGCNSPVAHVRLRPWSPTSEVEASSPFSPLTRVWVVDRGWRREARRAGPQRPARGTRLILICCTFRCSIYRPPITKKKKNTDHHCCGQWSVGRT
jgi:hypothetical protein